MANPVPCAACMEVADAEFLISNRLGVPWPFELSTVALCVPCFIQTGISMGEALQAAMAELQAMAEPGALEQVESDEGPVEVAAVASKSRKHKVAPKETAVAVETPATETPTPDDQG